MLPLPSVMWGTKFDPKIGMLGLGCGIRVGVQNRGCPNPGFVGVSKDSGSDPEIKCRFEGVTQKFGEQIQGCKISIVPGYLKPAFSIENFGVVPEYGL